MLCLFLSPCRSSSFEDHLVAGCEVVFKADGNLQGLRRERAHFSVSQLDVKKWVGMGAGLMASVYNKNLDTCQH